MFFLFSIHFVVGSYECCTSLNFQQNPHARALRAAYQKSHSSKFYILFSTHVLDRPPYKVPTFGFIGNFLTLRTGGGRADRGKLAMWMGGPVDGVEDGRTSERGRMVSDGLPKG